MADTPPTPRPRRRVANPPGETPREPVTTATPDTPPASPPRGGRTAARSGGDAPRPRAVRPTRSDKLESSLSELLSAPALIYAAAGDEWAATFVNKRAPVVAAAWVGLAEENPAVKRILTKLTTGSAWGGVIFATGGTVLPLLVHHGLLPSGLSLPFLESEEDGQEGGAIVPPPPGPPPSGQGAGRMPPPPGGHSDMTPPTKPGAPPGVVTVAGTNNRAVG